MKTPLRKIKTDWETCGNLDPCRFSVRGPKETGKWDVSEFLLSGDREVKKVISHASRLGYLSERVLDFGCGAGRLTRALAEYFKQYYGVDISESMIDKARKLNQSVPNCEFIINIEEHLQIFLDNYFDMIYTNLTLQHLPTKSIIKSYISEFIRILKERGLLIFQLPSHIPFKNRIQLRRKLYRLLRMLGLNEKFLYQKLGLNPMRMNFVPEKEVANFLNKIGAKLLEVLKNNPKDKSAFQDRIYYVTK